MPGPLYRMHGATTGAYAIRNLAVTNRVVLTNKAPASLIRGFGGPQLYLALERLVQRIAIELGLDPLEVIRAISFRPGRFPTRPQPGRCTIPATTSAASIWPSVRGGSRI